jgi:hypothetical protein
VGFGSVAELTVVLGAYCTEPSSLTMKTWSVSVEPEYVVFTLCS